MYAWTRIQTLATAMLTAAAVSLPGIVSAADLHAIFVIDTDDGNIGTMVAKDLRIMGGEIQAVAQAAGLTLKDRVYAGSDFTIDNVKNAVNSIQAGPDDVVFFYYSGHGFRTPTKQGRWPYFYFHSNNTIDFGWVADTLKSKGARLAISLVDACNNVVNVQVRELQKAAGGSTEGYRRLFTEYKGFVTGASSIPGETSIATSNGSLFTISFIKSLQNETQQSNPSWETVMQNGAGKRLTSGSSSQQPFYEMQVTAVGSNAGTQTSGTADPVRPPQPPAPTVQQPSAPPPATASNPPASAPASAPPPRQSGGAAVINF